MELEEKINLLKQLRDGALTNAKLNEDNAELKYYYLVIANTYDTAILILTNDRYAESISDTLNGKK